LLFLAAFALVSCGGAAEEEPPTVEDLGVDDGSSQDLPELEAAEAARNGGSGNASGSGAPAITDEPTDDGGSQDDYAAAGEYYTDEPTDDGGSQDDYSAAGEP
jgi:hypothetical protein